jgi:hypothetical protein
MLKDMTEGIFSAHIHILSVLGYLGDLGLLVK